MSNPFDPNIPVSPFQEPSSTGTPSRAGRKWLIGCAIIAVLALTCCVGSVAFTLLFAKSLFGPLIQAQASALGHGNTIEACGMNSPFLQSTMPCDAYVTWIQQNAAFFPGSTVTATEVNYVSDARGAHAVVRINAAGPHGHGSLTFSLSPAGNQWFIDTVQP